MNAKLHYRTLLIVVLTLPASVAYTQQRTNGFDLSDSAVPADEVFWGGVSRDGIQSIDFPKFVTADSASFLADKERILGVNRNGISKAYPIRILEHHEVVNDHFANEAIVVTYCPLCYSGMVFSAQGSDIALMFGVSGLLYNSDVLLYDRQTESLWSQLMSKSIAGPLKGMTMNAIPASHTTWLDWRQRHPDTLVLSTETGFGIRYRRRSNYRDYQRSGRLMFAVENRSNRYRKKELVLGIQFGTASKAYPFKELRKNGKQSFTDSVAGRTYTIIWSEKDQHARVIDASGAEIASVIAYWFAWYAFHPETEVFHPDDTP
jgi:hypothetical protein